MFGRSTVDQLVTLEISNCHSFCTFSISEQHALIENNNGSVFITPQGRAKTFLNGNEISERKEMHHHDRLMFGSNNLYVFHHPTDYAANQGVSQMII